MMPFAFDLISTFVIGSTLPVATTERTIVPLSTVASFDGSMFVDAPLSVEKPQTPPARTSVTTTAIRTRFLDLFIWAPCAGRLVANCTVDERAGRKVAADLCGF